MRVFHLLPLAALLCLGVGLLLSCGDDDDDNDDGQADTTGACYAQCEEGCTTPNACFGPSAGDADCAAWGAEQCEADGCALVQSLFVPDCDICTDCAGRPDWYQD